MTFRTQKTFLWFIHYFLFYFFFIFLFLFLFWGTFNDVPDLLQALSSEISPDRFKRPYGLSGIELKSTVYKVSALSTYCCFDLENYHFPPRHFPEWSSQKASFWLRVNLWSRDSISWGWVQCSLFSIQELNLSYYFINSMLVFSPRISHSLTFILGNVFPNNWNNGKSANPSSVIALQNKHLLYPLP